MKKLKKQTGFTLMEMMIVIVILGVLAAIAIPKYQDYIEKGDMADMKTLMLKVKQDYEVDKLQMPKSYETKDKAEREVRKLVTKHISASQLNKKYELSPVMTNVQGNSNVLALGFVATPKDAKRKRVFLDAGGNAYRCKGDVSTSASILTTKPNNCAEAF